MRRLSSGARGALRLAGLLLAAGLLVARGALARVTAGLLLLRLLAVRLASVVGDVEPRALEQQSRAAGGNPLRTGAAFRTAFRSVVGDAVKQLEPVLALRAPIIVGRHSFSISL